MFQTETQFLNELRARVGLKPHGYHLTICFHTPKGVCNLKLTKGERARLREIAGRLKTEIGKLLA